MTRQHEDTSLKVDKIEFANEVEGRVLTLEAIAQGLMPMLEQIPRPGAVLTDEEIADADEAMRRVFAFSGLLAKGLGEFLQYVEAVRR